MRTSPTSHNKNKYYCFHRDHGHKTENYIALKNEIEDLIWRGYLEKYINKGEVRSNAQNPS